MAQGWVQFEKTCSEVSAGELPQLLQYVKSKQHPHPPLKHQLSRKLKRRRRKWPGNEGRNCGETIGGETDPHQSGGEMVEYRCGNCDITPTRSKSGMDAHIRSVHTKKALLCSFCAFLTYNFDSLNRHMKEHN